MWTSTVCRQQDAGLLGYCEIISSQAYALNGAFKEHVLLSGEARLWEELGDLLWTLGWLWPDLESSLA